MGARKSAAGIEGATLPAPNARQMEEIEVTLALFEANAEVKLLTWHVIDPAQFLREGQEADGIYIEFLCRDYRNSPDRPPGREVTVFGEDGTVLDSHDFG